MPESVVGAVSPYQFKPSPFSSHTLILREFPETGGGRTVLDLGCASGYLARDLAARGYTVTGVDRQASPELPEIEFIPANLDEGLPRLNRVYDFVLCADVLEHLRDPLRLLRDIRNVLAPGGRLIASLPNSGHAWFRLNVLAGRFPQDDNGLFDRTHVRFYMWRGWVDLFARAGFRIETEWSSGTPVGLALPRWNGRLTSALETGAFWAARIWRKMFAYQFVVTASVEPHI